MSPCWMSCQPLGERLNNKSWTVHPNIAFRREGHRKIQVIDLYLVQMMPQCRATSRKSRHRSLHVAIPNVAGDTSRATCRLSRLTEHIQRNTCVANNVVVAVACRVSRVTEQGLSHKCEDHKLPSVVTRDLALNHESRLAPATRDSLSVTRDLAYA